MTTTTTRVTGDQRWRLSALCAQTDPEAFFPERGASPAAAKKVCAACPVQAACRAEAARFGDVMGVWAGTTETERKYARRGSAPICSGCGREFTRTSPNAKYCGDLCRQAARRETKNASQARRTRTSSRRAA
jgi:hypothetical protein